MRSGSQVIPDEEGLARWVVLPDRYMKAWLSAVKWLEGKVVEGTEEERRVHGSRGNSKKVLRVALDVLRMVVRRVCAVCKLTRESVRFVN